MEEAAAFKVDSNTLTTTTAIVFITTAICFFYIISKLRGRGRWEKYGVKQASHSLQELPTLMLERLMSGSDKTVGIIRDNYILITRDLDLLKQILVKDFNNFVDRSDYLPTVSPLGRGVFFLGGPDWKRIRQLMSPSFSTGKLKQISAHVYEAADSLAKHFENCARGNTRVKLLHTTGQYTTSIIAKTAFGVQADCIGEEEDDEFTHSAKNIFKRRNKWTIRLILPFMRFRSLRDILIKYFKVTFLDPCPQRTSGYFSSVLEESIKEREEAELRGTNRRNDFLQSLVSTKIAPDAANKGEIADPSVENVKRTNKRITHEEVIGQSLLTILAAFETTASTLQFCLYMLAKHQEIQEKVYAELKEEILQHHQNNGSVLKPSHEELSRLHYTEKVINETLRLFPPLPGINRKTINTYKYEGITIPAGAAISIPIRQIQRDPNNFPDPETFDPDRFSEEVKATRHPLAFMPFGQGPRLCIGMRLAYLELKAGLFFVLSTVKVELNETTVPPKGEDIEMNFMSFPRPETAVELAVKLRD